MSSSDPPASDTPSFMKEHRGSPEPDQGQNLAQLLSRVQGGKQGRFQDQILSVTFTLVPWSDCLLVCLSSLSICWSVPLSIHWLLERWPCLSPHLHSAPWIPVPSQDIPSHRSWGLRVAAGKSLPEAQGSPPAPLRAAHDSTNLSYSQEAGEKLCQNPRNVPGAARKFPE